MSDGAAALIAQMLSGRGAGKTLCPSEVARQIAGNDGDWRARMTEIHEAVDALASAGVIELSWKGRPLAQRDGPYRIGLPK